MLDFIVVDAIMIALGVVLGWVTSDLPTAVKVKAQISEKISELL
jgi:hypothetical protein